MLASCPAWIGGNGYALNRYAPANASRWLGGAELAITEWVPVGAYTGTLVIRIAT